MNFFSRMEARLQPIRVATTNKGNRHYLGNKLNALYTCTALSRLLPTTGDDFFFTSIGALLKGGRSNTFLVENLPWNGGSMFENNFSP